MKPKAFKDIALSLLNNPKHNVIKIKDKIKKFNELNDFYLFDARKYKKANRRQTEFEELKKWYLQKKGRDFKIEEYIYLLEQNDSKDSRKRASEYRHYLNNKKSYNKRFK